MGTIADRLSQVIASNKLTKKAFADKLGVNPSSVTFWLSGKNNPSAQTIKQISDTFGVNAKWLETGDGEPYTLDAAEKQAAEYLAHAITHNVTAKDAFLRAVAAADEATLASVLEFMQAVVGQIKA